MLRQAVPWKQSLGLMQTRFRLSALNAAFHSSLSSCSLPSKESTWDHSENPLFSSCHTRTRKRKNKPLPKSMSRALGKQILHKATGNVCGQTLSCSIRIFVINVPGDLCVFLLIPDPRNSFWKWSEEIKLRVSSSTLVSGSIHKHNIRKSNIDPGTYSSSLSLSLTLTLSLSLLSVFLSLCFFIHPPLAAALLFSFSYY